MLSACRALERKFGSAQCVGLELRKDRSFPGLSSGKKAMSPCQHDNRHERQVPPHRSRGNTAPQIRHVRSSKHSGWSSQNGSIDFIAKI